MLLSVKKTERQFVWAWVLTIPISAAISAATYLAIRLFL